MTVSMLQGESGHQRKEVEKLVAWLQEIRPDVVHLNNVMLLGPAREIRRRLGVPVVCSLTGEDVFLEKLLEPHYSAARRIAPRAGRRTRRPDGHEPLFRRLHGRVSCRPAREDRSHSARLESRRLRTETRPIAPITAIAVRHRLSRADLSRKGIASIGRGVEAFGGRQKSAADSPPRGGLFGLGRPLVFGQYPPPIRRLGPRRPFRIRSANSITPRKSPFCNRSMCSACRRSIAKARAFRFWKPSPPAFRPSCPATAHFPKCSKPPAAALLCEPENPAALAQALKNLILNPAQAQAAGRKAQQIVQERYNVERMSRQMLEWYRKIGDSGK